MDDEDLDDLDGTQVLRYLQLIWLHLIPTAAICAYATILIFIFGSVCEHLGYLFLRLARCCPSSTDKLPNEQTLPERVLPPVCVQLAMYNEFAVARRIINAACHLDWPRELLTVQILDDSTDPGVRAVVDTAAAEWQAAGIDCYVLRRELRNGFKAGALEA